MEFDVWTRDSRPYRDWMPPATALAALQTAGSTNSREVILQRLKSGGIRAIAYFAATEDERVPLVMVPRGGWANALNMSTNGPFWTLGDITFCDNRGEEVTFEDVRFDPDDMQRLISQLPPAKAAIIPTHPKVAPAAAPIEGRGNSLLSQVVSNEVLQAWFEKLPAADQRLGYRQLWPKAKEVLGAGVKRKQVEALCQGRKRGPKKGPK